MCTVSPENIDKSVTLLLLLVNTWLGEKENQFKSNILPIFEGIHLLYVYQMIDPYYIIYLHDKIK